MLKVGSLLELLKGSLFIDEKLDSSKVVEYTSPKVGVEL